MEKRIIFSVMSVAVLSMLQACSSIVTPTARLDAEAILKANQTDVGAQDGRLANQGGNAPRGSNAYAQRVADEQARVPVLRRATRPFISGTMVPSTDEDRLPLVFQKKITMDFDVKVQGRPVTLGQVASRISMLTGVPVRISPDVYQYAQSGATGGGQGSVSLGGAKTPSSGVPMPSPLVSASAAVTPMSAVAPKAERSESTLSVPDDISIDAIRMQWSGPLAGYLNNLVDRLGLAWIYQDNAVVIQRFVTEFHEVAVLPGATSYTMGAGSSTSGSAGGASAGSTSQASLDVGEKGTLDPSSSVLAAVQAMVANVPGSSVTRADGSGRLMVTTSRAMQAQVRSFLRSENAAMLRQAQIQFDIYTVTTDTSDQRGVDWQLLFSAVGSNALQLGFNSTSTLTGSTAGSLSAAVVSGVNGNLLSQRLGDSKALLQGLAEKGFNVQHRPVSLLALNRNVARKNKLTTQAYLSETVPGTASSTGAGAPGLKTDKVTVGDQYLAVPQILDDGTVLLKFGIALSDLVSLLNVSVGSGPNLQMVQTPNVSSVGDQYTVALKPGEVFVLSGLSREVAADTDQGLWETISGMAAGSRSTNTKREQYIIFVRAVTI